MRATYQHMTHPVEILAYAFAKTSTLLKETSHLHFLKAKSEILYTLKKDYSFCTVQAYMESFIDAISFFIVIGNILEIIKMCENYCDENNIDYYNLYDPCDEDCDPTLIIFPAYVIRLMLEKHLNY